MASDTDIRDYLLTPSDLARRLYETIGETEDASYRLLSTGLPELDRDLTIYPGSVTAVVGRPGMGKSLFCKALARAEVERIRAGDASEQLVVFVTLEEPDQKLTIQLGRLPFSWRDLRRREIADLPAAKVSAMTANKYLEPFWVVRHPGVRGGRVGEPLSCEKVMRAIEVIASDYGKRPTLVVLDYLQLLKGEGQPYTIKAKTEHVMAASAGALMMARNLGVAVVMAVQASREADSRRPPLPVLSDMQWASAIEQDCDIILGLCRPAAIPAVQEKIRTEGIARMPVAGEERTVTDSLMMLGVIKARDDGCAGRQYALYLDPVTLDLHGAERYAAHNGAML